MPSLLSLLIQAVLATAPLPEEPPGCSKVDDATVAITGAIDAGMADCLRGVISSATRELVVDTGGGDISSALDMAEMIHPLGLTIRVRGRCYSSCANYLIPASRRLVVEDRASIGLHGGVDPLLLKTDMLDQRRERVRAFMRDDPELTRAEAEDKYARAVETTRGLVERQKVFADKLGIGPGWFLYREPGDRDFGRYLTGRGGPRPHIFGWRYMLAEERLVRSCLPNVIVEPFQERLEANFINAEDRFASFRRSEGLRSGDLECTAGR